MYMMHNELMALHEQRLKDLRLDYVESVRQTARWKHGAGAVIQRFGVWFALLGKRMQATADGKAAANLQRSREYRMEPVRVRTR